MTPIEIRQIHRELDRIIRFTDIIRHNVPQIKQGRADARQAVGKIRNIIKRRR